MVGVAAHNRLPLPNLARAAHVGYFRQIEYRIACHESQDMLTPLLELSRYCCQIDFLRYAGAVLRQLLIVAFLLGALLMMSETGQAISYAVVYTEINTPYVSRSEEHTSELQSL